MVVARGVSDWASSHLLSSLSLSIRPAPAATNRGYPRLAEAIKRDISLIQAKKARGMFPSHVWCALKNEAGER